MQRQILNLGQFLVRSPLHKKFSLVSFPSLSNMLKFSEFFQLVGGDFRKFTLLQVGL